tara:strand:+ start:31 stop:1392 length:1362 start_codon:yes stop_codon:yes gene_type:complete
MGRKLSFTGIAAGGGGGGGGGGGDTGTFGTVHDIKYVKGDSGWTREWSYASMGRQYGGMKGNQYYFVWIEYNSPQSRTRQRIDMFSVNRSTGAITNQGSGSVWQNNSGAAVSTTHYSHVAGSGSGVSGGNNAWPGQSSHTFGYDYWQVYNGSISGSSPGQTYDSHHSNGSWHGLCSNSDNSGYSMLCGYYQQNNPWGQGSKAAFRTWYCNGQGSGPSVGGRQYPSNPHTSTNYMGHFYGQASSNTSQGSVHGGNNGLSNAIYLPHGSNNYVCHTVNGQGSTTTQFTVGTGQGNPTGIQLQNGNVLWYPSGNGSSHGVYESNSYSNHTSIDVATYAGQTLPSRNEYSLPWGPLSGDYWVTGFKSSHAVSWGIPLQIVKIAGGNVASGGGSTRKAIFNPDYDIYGALSDRYQMLCPLWENTSDPYPKKIVYLGRISGGTDTIVVSDLPDSADWAT